MSTPETSVIWLQILLLAMHWTAFAVLFAANAGLFRLVSSDEADQHKMFQGLALNRTGLWCWLFLAASGVGLVFLTYAPAPAESWLGTASARLMMLKTALAAIAFLIALPPWRFMRRHAVVRSYGWVNVPQHVHWCLRIELALILLVMVVAVVIRVDNGALLR